MDAAELEKLKAYMRVDGSDDDNTISALSLSAAAYLQNAGIKRTERNAHLYDLALWALTLHYYDHRGDSGGDDDFPVGLRLLINQMKIAGLADK